MFSLSVQAIITQKHLTKPRNNLNIQSPPQRRRISMGIVCFKPRTRSFEVTIEPRPFGGRHFNIYVKSPDKEDPHRIYVALNQGASMDKIVEDLDRALSKVETHSHRNNVAAVLNYIRDNPKLIKLGE